ncbi:MAG: protein kinase domain-containing protein, partial [Persicimonas sp.]
IYVAMEYLEGVDLKELIADEGTLSIGRAVDITRQMLDGLAEAHSHDFIHRDLKPSNVFITKNRRGEDFVKLLDFGIAKSLSGADVDLTASGSICGTPSYVAPEYLRNAPLVKASDTYAVGLMLLEMLIGRRVFHGEAPVQTLMMQLKLEPDIPIKIARTPLAKVIRRATAKAPEERYTDADQMLQALEAVLDELPKDIRLDPDDLDEVASTPPPMPTSGIERSLAEDSASSLPEVQGTPVGLSEGRAKHRSRRPPPVEVEPVEVEPVEVADAGADSEADSGADSGAGAGSIAEQIARRSAAGDRTGSSVSFELPEPRKLWMIGGGFAGTVALVITFLMILNPGGLTEMGEAEGAATADEPATAADDDSSTGGALASNEARGAEAEGDQLKGDQLHGNKPDEGPAPFEFDLDSDPSGASVRVGGEVVGTTPMVYEVPEDQLPQELTFELDGYEPRVVPIGAQSSPIVVEVLDEQKEQAPRASGRRASGSRPQRSSNRGAQKTADKKNSDISDDSVEQVLDEFLVE